MDEQRAKLLESLKDATKRKTDAQAAKKRDTRLHNENISSIDQEIEEIMEQLGDDD